MRLLKFRDFNNDNMRYFDIKNIPDDTDTIMQFTGLLDKHGKEIYEGDIVSFEDTGSSEMGLYDFYNSGKVVWEEESASFQVTDRQSVSSEDVFGECLVIGNIYETADMI